MSPSPHCVLAATAMAERGQWLSARSGGSAQAARGRVGVWGLARERHCGEVSSSSWKLSRHMDALHSSIVQGKVGTSRAGVIKPSGEIISHISGAASDVCLA